MDRSTAYPVEFIGFDPALFALQNQQNNDVLSTPSVMPSGSFDDTDEQHAGGLRQLLVRASALFSHRSL